MMLSKIIKLSLIFLAYFISGKLGLELASVNTFSAAVWAPAGIAIASLILFGKKLWPVIFLAAFFTNLTTTGTIFISLGIATGNTLEGLVASYLITHFAGGRSVFNSARGILKFIIFAGFACMISVTWGISSLLLGGIAEAKNYSSVWTTWWLGDISGAILITPLILFWTKKYQYHWNNRRLLEGVFLLFGIILVSGAVFNSIFFRIPSYLPLAYLCIPLLVWSSIRFDRRETLTAILIMAVISIWGTTRGHGPYSLYSPNESLLLLQTFLDVVTVMILALTALVADRKRVDRIFQSTLDNMSEGFQIIGFDFRYLYVNDAVAKQGKRTQDELLGHSMMEMYPGIEKTEVFKYLKKCLLERKPHEMDNKFVYQDGSEGWFRIKIEPISEGALILSIDITREKEVDEMKTEFISMASHELRTPLSAIKGFISMINDGDYGKVDEKLVRPLSLVAVSTQRLINIVNEMLDVSRIEADRVKLNLGNFYIQDLIEEATATLKPLIAQKNLQLKIEKRERLGVNVDKEKVIEILNNLIGNSLKFTEKGSITIRIELKKEKVVVFVADTGVGIEKKDQAKLFNKFEQIKFKRAGNVSGTGLGLYISREFARKMGGDLWIEESAVGKGSTFAVSLTSSKRKINKSEQKRK
ncbi:MAG TPA: MASE1 domain-containing protein [Xanthomonadales bacterium]|nr:MASE1 domain-containing protein [Xanthomonadales bacterium]